MVKQMARRQGIKVRAKDPCAYCGEPLASTAGFLGVLRAGDVETAWDGERWVPYHHICWQQLRYQQRLAASTGAAR